MEKKEREPTGKIRKIRNNKNKKLDIQLCITKLIRFPPTSQVKMR